MNWDRLQRTVKKEKSKAEASRVAPVGNPTSFRFPVPVEAPLGTDRLQRVIKNVKRKEEASRVAPFRNPTPLRVPVQARAPLGTRAARRPARRTGSGLTAAGQVDKALIPSYLEDTVRESTKRSYGGYWTRYKNYCAENNIILTKPESISMFLINLSESTKGNSAPLLAKNSIKYHLKLLYPFKRCATDTWFVSSILKTAKKKFGKPVKKAKPFNSDIVLKLISYWQNTGSFKDERSSVFILMQFLLFARYEETANLKKENVKLLESGDLEVLFEQAKNFSVWNSKTSCLAKGSSSTFDPVQLVQSYMSKLDNSSDWLFPNFRKGKVGSVVFLDSPVSYDNMLKLLRDGLEKIGLEGQDYTLHSPRVGAVSEAVNSGNCDREIIQRHVRWASPEMVGRYHKLSLSSRLQPSLALNIYNL